MRLVFHDGKEFKGRVFAGGGQTLGEVVFNTSMTGYQEILTDPSYHGQMVVMTYPLIGNYGVNLEDVESKKIHLSALIVKEYSKHYSNWRATQSLKDYLEDNNILGVEGFDTRAITKYIRESGAMKAILTDSEAPISELIKQTAAHPDMDGANFAAEVTTGEAYDWPNSKTDGYKVAVLDCGAKHSILKLLSAYGCQCTVVPITVTSEEIVSGRYDGLFLSNGPGDPEPVESAIQLVRELKGKLAIAGICLGHQIISIALGGQTYKLKFGHHGANHPILNTRTGKIEITSQNHGFAVDRESLNESLIEVTHINLNDQTVAGICDKETGVFSVQYHPESSPGPHDSQYFFDSFVNLLKRYSEESVKQEGNRLHA